MLPQAYFLKWRVYFQNTKWSSITLKNRSKSLTISWHTSGQDTHLPEKEARWCLTHIYLRKRPDDVWHTFTWERGRMMFDTHLHEKEAGWCLTHIYMRKRPDDVWHTFSWERGRMLLLCIISLPVIIKWSYCREDMWPLVYIYTSKILLSSFLNIHPNSHNQ